MTRERASREAVRALRRAAPLTHLRADGRTWRRAAGGDVWRTSAGEAVRCWYDRGLGLWVGQAVAGPGLEPVAAPAYGCGVAEALEVASWKARQPAHRITPGQCPPPHEHLS